MKKKEIRIIKATILLVVALIVAISLLLSFTNISYAPTFNKPNHIIIYYKDASKNIVFDSTEQKFDEIYSEIISSCKKNVFNAITDNDLNKSPKIISTENSQVKFNDIVINFVYNAPQKLKNTTQHKDYWYQNLIFKISSQNKFVYNSVAIILPETSNQYISPFTYNLQYQIYSNYSKCYDICKNLF